MTPIELEQALALNYNILLEIEAVFKEVYKGQYNTKITKTDTRYTLCTDNFILTFFFEDLHFFLTFMVGQNGKRIANDTKIIMSILDASEFTLMEDSFFDKEENELMFGSDAMESKLKETLKYTGKTKCPICERIFPNELILETGICKICEKKKSDIIWN